MTVEFNEFISRQLNRGLLVGDYWMVKDSL